MKESPMFRKALMLVVVFCACGSDPPADIAGTYTMSLTVQQNQCGILTNPSGSSSTGVSVKVTQSGSEVSAQVQGASGVAQYAEGHRITSYFSIGKIQDGGVQKDIWLWTTSEG